MLASPKMKMWVLGFGMAVLDKHDKEIANMTRVLEGAPDDLDALTEAVVVGV